MVVNARDRRTLKTGRGLVHPRMSACVSTSVIVVSSNEHPLVVCRERHGPAGPIVIVLATNLTDAPNTVIVNGKQERFPAIRSSVVILAKNPSA